MLRSTMRREGMPRTGRKVASASDQSGELIERTGHLSALGESLSAVVARSEGRIVLVAGEAGAGKTVLLPTPCESQQSASPCAPRPSTGAQLEYARLDRHFVASSTMDCPSC